MTAPTFIGNPAIHLVASAGVALPPHQRDRAPRQRTLIRAVLSGVDMPDQDVIVRNVSEYGMGIAGRGLAPDRGETVTVTLPSRLALKARVRWVNDKVFGVELTERLDVRQLGLSTQRRNSRLAAAVDWQIEDRYRQDEPRPMAMRRGC